MTKKVGIIGYGNFGKFLHKLAGKFFPNISVRVYSRRAKIDNQTFFSLETVCRSDVVILCGAIHEYKEQLTTIVSCAREDSILVDVATVKKYTNELMRELWPTGRFISTHPMFGPESYKKHGGNVDGFRVVVTDYTLRNDDYQRLKNLFAGLGFVMIEMTAEEHDQRLAETLFLTHYVGQSIIEAGFERTTIDTLSFQFLMDAVDSIRFDKKLFTDVYDYNPYCKKVAERLHTAQEQVYQSLQ